MRRLSSDDPMLYVKPNPPCDEFFYKKKPVSAGSFKIGHGSNLGFSISIHCLEDDIMRGEWLFPFHEIPSPLILNIALHPIVFDKHQEVLPLL